MLRVVLILAGGVASPQEAKEASSQANFIIAADGGLDLAQKAGLPVDLVIGDLDSLAGPLPQNLRVLRVPKEKDATDLELALDHAVSLGAKKILVVGAFGARLDHTLANANLLEKYDIPITLFHRGSRVHLVIDHVEIQAQVGDLVSLLPLTPAVRGISTWGLRYPLEEGVLFRASTRGISNEVVAIPCGVKIRAGKLLLIHTPKGGGVCGNFLGCC
ncbi:MAG: thiamine diphosphokinase [Candidatus Bipolaricaulota bacterium]|nr:thiamine diphosphokinase [Candidatus Bipolaricaulota bacterium]MDW8127004.1 thiamine diphosphokinase [Candidatus Bipolaricaulota bacterium]